MGSTLALLAALILVRGAPPPRDPAVPGAPARRLRGALRPRPPRARAGARRCGTRSSAPMRT